MTAAKLAKKLGFKVAAREDAQVFVSPGLGWVLVLRDRYTAFGPIDDKPFEERSHRTAAEAEGFTCDMLKSIARQQENC